MFAACSVMICGNSDRPKASQQHDLKIAGNASSRVLPREAPMHLRAFEDDMCSECMLTSKAATL